MEIQYQNQQADFRAYYEMLRGPQKSAQRHAFYYGLAWYLTVLGLGCYLAVKYTEIFATCVFVVLAGFYLKDNWSFRKYWEAQAKQYGDGQPETSNRLTLDEHGIRENFSGIQVSVAWSEIHGFTLMEARLYLHFHK